MKDHAAYFTDRAFKAERRCAEENRERRKVKLAETEVQKRRRLQCEIDAIQWPSSGVPRKEREEIMERVRMRQSWRAKGS